MFNSSGSGGRSAVAIGGTHLIEDCDLSSTLGATINLATGSDDTRVVRCYLHDSNYGIFGTRTGLSVIGCVK